MTRRPELGAGAGTGECERRVHRERRAVRVRELRSAAMSVMRRSGFAIASM